MKNYKPYQIRVFISSTFQDMQAERDVLIKKVAPQLRDICAQRNIFLSFVDLRWGITAQESEDEQVISICLDEIERCRPYFIGILGNRYGWIPETIPDDIITKYHWVTDFKGRSVTELEIQYGALQHPDPERVLFYFRGLAANDDTSEKLEQLKARIRAQHFPVKKYLEPEEFGSYVLQDMQELIATLFPAAENVEPYEIQLFEHQFFASELCHVYVANQEYFDVLDSHTQSNDQPLVITGEPGTGKSALLANWARRWHQSETPGLLVEYYIGASVDSTDWQIMVLQLIRGIKDGLNIPTPLPQIDTNLKAAFVDWLHLAKDHGGLTLVIDGLDQLTDKDNALDLLWLPATIPENICLIMSSRAGRPLHEVTQRGWTVYQVEPLSMSERRRFAVAFLDVSRKRFDESQLSVIERAENAANPLFLRALLEELRIFGEYDYLNQRMAHYLEAKDTVGLYERIIERYQQDYESARVSLVKDTLTALWAARGGLSEPELMQILGSGDNIVPSAIWSPFLLSLEASLSNKGGLYSYANEAFRQAVETLFLPEAEQRKAAHLSLADLFEESDSLNRKVDELAWQLSEAKEYYRLAVVLSDFELLHAIISKDLSEIVGYWDNIEKHTDHTVIETYARVIDEPENYLEQLYDVSTLLMNTLEEQGATWYGGTGKHWAAIRMLQSAQKYCADTGQSELELKFLDYEYKVRHNFRFHFKEFKKAHLASITKDSLLRKIELLRKLEETDELFNTLIQYNENRFEYASGFQGQETLSIIAEGLPYLMEAERVARDSDNIFYRVRALIYQSLYYGDIGHPMTAYHFADLAWKAAVLSNDKDALIDALTRQGELLLLVGYHQEAQKCFDSCLDLLRQVSTLSTIASRITTISQYYILYSGDAAGFEKGLKLRDEARRLNKIVGNWDPILNPARDGFLKMQLSQMPASGSPLSDYAYRKVTTDHGPMWRWWSVPSEMIQDCQHDVNACYKVLVLEDSVIEKMDFQYIRAMQYLLQSLAGDLPDHAEQWHRIFIEHMNKAGYPTEHFEQLGADAMLTTLAAAIDAAILGIHPLNSELDRAKLYYKYNRIEEVSAISLLTFALALWPGFHMAYNGRELDEKNIYPGGWEEWGAEGFETLWEKFQQVVEFFMRAKEAGATVICGPSGDALERIVEMRIPVKVEPVQPNHAWFTGKASSWDVDGTCRSCGYKFSFEPRAGERPPNACPICNHVG